MQIYIMRHGQAFTSGSIDALRGLTDQGKLEATVMTKWLKNQDVEVDQMLISPFIRAQETAQKVTSGFDESLVATTLDFITPSGSARMLHDYIDGVCASEKVETLLIVSHMPLVSYLVAELTTNNDAPIFQTASIAQIDYDVKRMKGFLVGLTSPSDLC
jgi:phosphohistidine phosphatase